MPKPRKNKLIRCVHFAWRLTCRNRCWDADARTNRSAAGRHSLGTKDLDEAMQRLPELDRRRAVELGLIPPSEPTNAVREPLPLGVGRKLYEGHLARPRS